MNLDFVGRIEFHAKDGPKRKYAATAKIKNQSTVCH